jgi:hypothetical protein
MSQHLLREGNLGTIIGMVLGKTQLILTIPFWPFMGRLILPVDGRLSS